MDSWLQIILYLLTGIAGISGTTYGITNRLNAKKTDDKVSILERDVIINNHNFTNLQLQISKIENKIDILSNNVSLMVSNNHNENQNIVIKNKNDENKR